MPCARRTVSDVLSKHAFIAAWPGYLGTLIPGEHPDTWGGNCLRLGCQCLHAFLCCCACVYGPHIECLFPSFFFQCVPSSFFLLSVCCSFFFQLHSRVGAITPNAVRILAAQMPSGLGWVQTTKIQQIPYVGMVMKVAAFQQRAKCPIKSGRNE